MAADTAKLALPRPDDGFGDWGTSWRTLADRVEARLTKQGTADPNVATVGDFVGQVYQQHTGTDHTEIWICTTAGGAGVAVWQPTLAREEQFSLPQYSSWYDALNVQSVDIDSQFGNWFYADLPGGTVTFANPVITTALTLVTPAVFPFNLVLYGHNSLDTALSFGSQWKFPEGLTPPNIVAQDTMLLSVVKAPLSTEYWASVVSSFA